MNVKSIGREQNTRITGKAAYSIPSYFNSSRTFLPTPGKGRLALPPVKTIEQGTATSVLLAASPDVEGVTGRYYEDCAEATPVSERGTHIGGVAPSSPGAAGAGEVFARVERGERLIVTRDSHPVAELPVSVGTLAMNSQRSIRWRTAASGTSG